MFWPIRWLYSVLMREKASLAASHAARPKAALFRTILEKLSHGDHYLLVLADAARPTRKGLRHNLKMLFIALAFLAYAALDMYFRHWFRDH
jgi:hypothetical protein